MALKIKNSERINLNKAEALKELKAEKKETITLLVSVSLKKKAKMKALQNNTNLTNVILGFLEEYAGRDK